MRDRLIELLDEAIKDGSESYSNIADYLLTNSVVALTCKVGDTVYRVNSLFKKPTITKLKVMELTIDRKGVKTLYGMTNRGSVYRFDRGHNLNDIKFTREEAERALKGGAEK